MSGPMDINSQVMQWRPRLIKLTMIANPEWNNGAPMPCYVDPQEIKQIVAVACSFSITGAPTGSFYPRVNCTEVRCFNLPNLPVLETVEEVARLRDEALGYKSVDPLPPATVHPIK